MFCEEMIEKEKWFDYAWGGEGGSWVTVKWVRVERLTETFKLA